MTCMFPLEPGPAKSTGWPVTPRPSPCCPNRPSLYLLQRAGACGSSLFWLKAVKGEAEGLKPAETGFSSGWRCLTWQGRELGSRGAHGQRRRPWPPRPPPTLRLQAPPPSGTRPHADSGVSIHWSPERGQGQARVGVLPLCLSGEAPEERTLREDQRWAPRVGACTSFWSLQLPSLRSSHGSDGEWEDGSNTPVPFPGLPVHSLG